ncbi:MAG: hypothetical protein WCY62_04215 [Clostridia bacterium]
MKKKRSFLIFIIIMAVLTVAIGAYAYYEYYGKYSALIQIDGVIRLDAFGALDDDYRGTENGYGITPENPFIVDTKVRMNNLIVLNNDGKLLTAKEVYGNVDKFYFAFDFTEQETPQVLDMTGVVQTSVGNNDYPFVDDLSGMLYAYLVSESEYIYLSGGGLVDITVDGGIVYINGTAVTLSSGTASAGAYVKVPAFYYSAYTALAADCITTTDGSYYVPVSLLLAVPQIVANATVKPPYDQLDVGFFSTIGREYEVTTDQYGNITVNEDVIVNRGYIRDVILYNITIDCTETLPGMIRAALDAIWNAILAGIPGHNFADTVNQTDERHIGLFAGHIDGMAENITIAGEGIIEIGGADVNAYSRFTTVGYIDDRAIINGVLFSELLTSGTGMGMVTGCLFADSIYDLAEQTAGVYEYPLTSVAASQGIWSGVNDNSFSQGIFRFVLSQENDTVSTIWQGRGNVYLLNEAGFNVTQSVLYCSDEYRYSETQQGGGSLVSTGASANETRYTGISPLTASSSILDKGKYIIVAKVYSSTEGIYRYYALKIVADVTENGVIDYIFDNTEKVDVTDYITAAEGTEGIYTSCIWQTDSDTSTPTFQNTRFKTKFLSVDTTSSVDISLTEDSGQAAAFRCSVLNNTFTYTITEQSGGGYISVKYYLNFNPQTLAFSFSTENSTAIEIYQISNGFDLEMVDSTDDLTVNDDYIIVAQSGGINYLIGAGTTEGVGGALVVDGSFSSDLSLSSMPDNWTISEYQAYKRYVWNAPYVSGASIAFREKLSATYYLGYSELSLALSSQQYHWTYTQNTGLGGTLGIISRYLSYSYLAGATGFNLAAGSYTIYIYKLIPDDTEPDYNTYQGAKLVTSDSSIVQEGQYMIAVNTGTVYQAVTMNGTNTLSTANVTAFTNGTASSGDLATLLDGGANEGYKWTVDATSSTPSFQNAKYPSYLSRSGDAVLALSATSVSWMYDAVSGRLYYTYDGTVIYYLVYTGTAFTITSDADNPAYFYDIRIYKVTYEYQYSDVVPVQSISYTDSTFIDEIYVSENKYYFFLTAPLNTIETTAPYVLGSEGTVDQATIESLNLASTSSYDSVNNIFTTTSDLSYFRWRLDTRMIDSTTAYETGYQFRNDVTDMYLGASNNPSSRTLVVVAVSNINLDRTSTYASLENNADSASPTGFGLGGTSISLSPGSLYRTDGSGNYIGNSFYVMGRRSPYEYYVWKTPSPGVFALALNTTDGISSPAPSEYSLPYLYEASGYTINVLISEVSEVGDNLDPDMHYMITAVVENQDNTTSYYAVSETLDNLGNKVLTGTNVTSQATTINNSNILDEFDNIIEESSTDILIMVPVESDWYQTSSEKNLNFYQDYYSTNAIRDYLTASGTSVSINSIDVLSSTQPTNWYYDAISKYLIYSDGMDYYYLTYNVISDTFSLTTDKSSATNINIYRFKPTYVVSRVTDAADDSLKDGNFIILGRDAEGYTALGINDEGSGLVAENVSEFIKDKLTETERNEILNYIWKQQYYDFYSTPYDPVSTTLYLQLFSYITGGGFTVIYDTSTGGMELSSDPMIWRITNTNGLWTFINNRLNGQVAANSRGITFTGDTSRMTIADTAKSVDRYVSSGVGYSFAVSGYSVILCDTSGNPVTTPVAGTSYILLARSGSTNYTAVKNTTGTISLVEYSSSTASDSGCLWTVTANVGGWVLKNGSYYISANASGVISASTTATGTWAVNTSTGAISFSTYNFPYYLSSSSIGITTNTGTYSLGLYDYTYAGGVGTLVPTTTAGSDKVLVFRTNTTYRALRINTNSFSYTSLASVVVQANGTITTSTSLLNTTAILTATQSGTGITVKSSSRYLTYNGSTFGRSSSAGTTFYLDTKGYFYYSKGTTYTPYVTTALNASASSGITAYLYEYDTGSYFPVTADISGGNTYVMVVYDDSSYYLIGADGSLLTRTLLGTSLITGWESGIVSAQHHITSIAGSLGNYLMLGTQYLTVSTDSILLSGTQTTQWEYSYTGQYGADSRLYSVVTVNLSAAYLTVGTTNNIETISTVTDVILYQASLQLDGSYTLTSKTTSGKPTSGDYIIVIYKDGTYYAVRYTSSGVIAYNLGSSVLPESVIADMVWTADASGFKKVISEQTYYLRRNTAGLYVSSLSGSTWVYTYTNVTASFTATNTSTTPLYIFRVDKSSELDDVTDTISMLSGKAKLNESVSLLESSNYVIIAEVDSNSDDIVDKYYSLGMVDIYNTQAMDVTDIMELSSSYSSSYITFFDAGVWNNKGSEIDLIFKNLGFTDSYYLTGAYGNMSNMTPQIEQVDEQNLPDLTEYIWKIYTFNESGVITYLLGYTDISTGQEIIYYMYFDPVALEFKLTSNYITAAGNQGRVQLYQLASESADQPVFQSYVIDVDEDGQTILSYPINLVESQDDLVAYSQTETENGVTTTGEYLIAAVNDDNYYAATFSELLLLSYIDVCPFFAGNYSIDIEGNYTISINSEYVWKQISDPALGLNFTNNGFNDRYIYTNDALFTYDIENRQLYYGSYYVSFDLDTGFTISTSPSPMPIYLYLLGESGIETGTGDGELTYSYYTQPLTTIGGTVDFSKFNMTKTLMPDLNRYGVDYEGNIGSQSGWTLYDINQILQTADSSVFFSAGITNTEDTEVLSEEFIPVTHNTMYTDELGDEYPADITYYAPKGSSSFVIDEANADNPVFVNVIATTEFDQYLLNAEYLRYLALWKVANIDLENGQANALSTYGDGLDEAANYAYTFIQQRQTPKAAIPLPNRYGSQASGASYARIDGVVYTLSDAQYGEDYYIAHTYVITEPGVYYLGASYGSLGICYLSVDNRALTEEGEVPGMGSESLFTIDFAYGGLEDIAYVGSSQWYQSNIYPQFIMGTVTNPTDFLSISVNRTLSEIDGTTSVNFKAYTTAAIAPGILHVNDNTAAQRLVRKVDFSVYCSGLTSADYTGIGDRVWIANADGTTLSLSTVVLVEGVEENYYLNIVRETFDGLLIQNQPKLSTSGTSDWICSNGYIMTHDGYYMVKTTSGYELSYSSTNAVRLYSNDGNLTPITSPSDNGTYLLIAFNGTSYICVTVNPAQ